MENLCGKLVVFEGTDKSGKTTQSILLYNYLKSKNVDVEYICFPNRHTPIGKILNKYLKKKKYYLNSKSAHLLFSANRWEKYNEMKEMLSNKKIIIADRYYYSGTAYTLTKEEIAFHNRESFKSNMEWCLNCDEGLIQPSFIFYFKNNFTDDSLYKTCSNNSDKTLEIYEEINFQKTVQEKFDLIFSKINNETNIVEIEKSNSIMDNFFIILKKLNIV